MGETDKLEILEALRVVHQEIDRQLESINARLEHLEGEVQRLSECYSELEARPARQALERQRELSSKIIGAVITVTTGGTIALLAKIVIDYAGRFP